MYAARSRKGIIDPFTGILLSLIIVGTLMLFLFFSITFTSHFEGIFPYKLLYITASNFLSRVHCRLLPPGFLPMSKEELKELIESHKDEIATPLVPYAVFFIYYDPETQQFNEIKITDTDPFANIIATKYPGMYSTGWITLEQEPGSGKLKFYYTLPPGIALDCGSGEGDYMSKEGEECKVGMEYPGVVSFIEELSSIGLNTFLFTPYSLRSLEITFSFEDFKRLIKPPMYISGVLYGDVRWPKERIVGSPGDRTGEYLSKMEALKELCDRYLEGVEVAKTEKFARKEYTGISPTEIFCNSMKTTYYLMPVVYVEASGKSCNELEPEDLDSDPTNTPRRYFGYVVFVTLPFLEDPGDSPYILGPSTVAMRILARR